MGDDRGPFRRPEPERQRPLQRAVFDGHGDIYRDIDRCVAGQCPPARVDDEITAQDGVSLPDDRDLPQQIGLEHRAAHRHLGRLVAPRDPGGVKVGQDQDALVNLLVDVADHAAGIVLQRLLGAADGMAVQQLHEPRRHHGSQQRTARNRYGLESPATH